MFYRRKIVLALLQLFDRKIDKINLQVLLFLFTQQQSKPEYDFIPLNYGCYSYSLNADVMAMIKKGMLGEIGNYIVSNETTDYFALLKPDDKKWLLDTKNRFGKLDADALTKYVYKNFPYWAINSANASEILTPTELAKVEDFRPKSEEIVMFTIGYEGISLEEYFNHLIKNGIKILVDVRNNPYSMKFGFSKNQLQRFCNSLGIDYVHFPELGIQAEQRKDMKTQADYDNLFAIYAQTNLTKTIASQEKILNLLKEHKRIALTCYEANYRQCHRKYLAEAIQNLPNFIYKVKHI